MRHRLAFETAPHWEAKTFPFRAGSRFLWPSLAASGRELASKRTAHSGWRRTHRPRGAHDARGQRPAMRERLCGVRGL